MLNKSSGDDDVVKFIDAIEGKKHIALIYDDPDFAKLLKFRFIKNGLQHDETCMCVTDEDSGKTVIDMLNYGIPMRYFQTKKLLVRQHLPVKTNREDMEKEAKKNFEVMQKSLSPPFRIVGRIVPNTESVDGMSVQVDMEKISHEHFANFGGIIVCVYDITKIERTQRKKWIIDLHRYHHNVISLSAKHGNTVSASKN